MAAKVGILDVSQDIQSTPVSYVKRSVADLLVRRLLAERLSNSRIRMVEIQAHTIPAARFALKPRPYIPEKMPSREVPGCYFQPPQSDTWKLQHRSVNLASL